MNVKKKPAEDVVRPSRATAASLQLLSRALSETNDEVKEPIGQRSMANSLVGGNINSRKTRSLLFVKTEQKPDQQQFQGKSLFSRVDLQVTRVMILLSCSLICELKHNGLRVVVTGHA